MKKLSVFIVLAISALSVAEANPPSVFFNSFLSNFKVSAIGGYIYTGKWWVKNLPTTVAEGNIVLSKNGKGIYDFKWTAGTADGEDTEINIAQPTDMATGQHVGMPAITQSGDYTLDLMVEGKKIFTYPFKAEILGEYVFTDGDWNDWGHIFYPDGDPLRGLSWRIWLRNKSETGASKQARVSVEIADAGGQVLFASSPTITWTIPADWQRFQFEFKNPPGHKSGEEYTKAKYLLEKDGAYTLTMKIGSELYGVWKLSVKGGKLVTVGRAARAGTDPLTYIEGGGAAFWYRKEK